MPSAVTLRAATEPDLDRLVEIHAACYPDDRGSEARRRNFVQNGMGHFDDLRVAERHRRIVGHGFAFSMTAYFGGAAVRALGIASVGVAPEARGTGVGSAIVDGLEAVGRERGACVSLLHAYRHGFYARRGYADVAPNRRIFCDPRAVPSAWVARARSAGLRAATGEDAPRIVDLHVRAARASTGWLERSERAWARSLSSERLHVLVFDRGFLSFELAQRAPHAETRLFVHDFVAEDDDARRALWGFLGMQAGQVAEIEIEIAEGDPVLFALADVDGARFGDERVEHDLGRIVAGPMLRLLDVREALASRGYASDGEVDLDVEGASLRVLARDGRASVEPGSKADALALDARTLASIAFGGLRVQDAACLGLARGSDAAVARAAALLSLPPFFTVDRF